jgi:hypothetical protein
VKIRTPNPDSHKHPSADRLRIDSAASCTTNEFRNPAPSADKIVSLCNSRVQERARDHSYGADLKVPCCGVSLGVRSSPNVRTMCAVKNL